jgi:Holliday junction DNA helicase RuvA
LSPDEAVQAILSADVATIQKVKGIGSKTAQRIILDLKDKISKGSLGATEGINALNSSNKSHQDALSALLMLGFGKAATEKVLDKVVKDSGQDISVEQLIKAALQRL